MPNLIARGVHVLTSLPSNMSCSNRIVIGRTRNFTRKLFEGLPLGLGNEKSGEDTAQHEQRVDLHDVIKPWRWVGGRDRAPRPERTNEHLSDNGADLPGCGREAVRSRTIACREAFSRDDESCSVGTL